MLMRLAWVARFADIFKSGAPKCSGILQICVLSLFQNQAEIIRGFSAVTLPELHCRYQANADFLERFYQSILDIQDSLQ